MKKILFLLVVLLSITPGLRAAFWKCELPGGTYTVSLSTISSISSHEYIVDGVARVTEVTIGNTSPVVARFYYIEPVTPKSPIGLGQSVIDKAQEHVQDIAGRVEAAGVEPVWKKVVKTYPTTTHAHTVEYRLESLEQLAKLQKSAEDAWRNNSETDIKIP